MFIISHQGNANKLTMSLDYIPVRMATIKNGDTVADDSGTVGRTWITNTLLNWKCKIAQLTFLIELNI